MSSGRPETRGARWRKRPDLRLATGYALLFTLSAGLLSLLAYAALGVFLLRQDAAYLRAQLQTAEAAYADGGLAGLRRHAADLQADDRGEEVLIRLADPRNAPRLLVPPDGWLPSDLDTLAGAVPDGALTIDNTRERQTLDVETRRLATGEVLQVGLNSDERDDVLEAFPRVFPFLAVPLLLLAVLGGVVMARHALRPVRQLVGTLEAIAATGDVRERAPTAEAGGEFADLGGLFNRMLDRIEGLVDRLRATLDDVAHDLRTPLTAIRGTAELALQRDRDAEAYRSALARIAEGAGAAETTLTTVLDAAEADAGALRLDRQWLDLDTIAADVAELYGLVAEDKGVAFDTVLGGAGAVDADRQRVRRALANLLDNAVKYTPPGGRVVLTTGRDGEGAWVRVRDTGAGIPPDELPRIWDRLYRSERTRHERGLGLGLGLARAIAEAHGGRLVVESALDVGSTFTLRLPSLSDL